MSANGAKPLDPNLTMVLLAVIGIIVPIATLVVNFIENSRIATAQSAEVRNVAVKVEDARRDLAANTSAATVAVRDVATKVEQARQDSVSEAAAVAEKVEETDQKLEVIHDTLVNGPPTQTRIEELEKLLNSLAPNDKRVQEILSR